MDSSGYSRTSCFPKSSRLCKRKEFTSVFDNGKKFVSRCVVVVARDQKVDDEAKLGIVVSRKVGNAVVRNRLKRQIREHFRQKKESLKGFEIVVIGRHVAKGAATHEVGASLKQCFDSMLKKKETQRSFSAGKNDVS
ncbi:MAG: ribonuclease P protein component [Oligoflexales bacterium]